MGLTAEQESKLTSTLAKTSQALGIVEDIYNAMTNSNGRAEDIAAGIAQHNNADDAHPKIKKTTELFARTGETGDDIAAVHRNIYRGKNMTNYMTLASLATKLQNGDFSDLFIGDYWTLPIVDDGVTKSVNFRIADFNYWKYMGDTSFTQNHVVFVPDTALKNMQMQTTNITEGGVTATLVWNELQTSLYNAVNAASCMNGHVQTHRQWFPVTMNPDAPSGAGANLMGAMVSNSGEWKDVKLGLMTEPMALGTTVFTSGGYEVECGKTQLALFRLDPTWLNGRASRCNWWLGAVASSGSFAYVYGFGLIGGGTIRLVGRTDKLTSGRHVIGSLSVPAVGQWTAVADGYRGRVYVDMSGGELAVGAVPPGAVILIY
ncbi:MAG: hypothetical protein IJU76_08320 [Desulfovibrionaceae bacterium]|nr:hypothetical protein [Desulfovibrionaceae bacterium]